MTTKQKTNTVTQYDTLLAQFIVEQNDVWTRQITNPLTEERLLHPLQNDIITLQIYNAQHCTTLITNKNRYYYYDGLGIAVPQTVSRLHTHMRQWYGDSTKPLALQTESFIVHTPYTPQQTLKQMDGAAQCICS